MITYLYWFLVAVLVIGALFGIGVRLGKWKPALIIAAVIWLVATLAYYFWLEQIFVKRFGGTMNIKVPEEQYHIGATWKGDNLWIQNYNPLGTAPKPKMTVLGWSIPAGGWRGP